MFRSLKMQQHRYATSKVFETSKGAAKGSKTTSKKDLKQANNICTAAVDLTCFADDDGGIDTVL